MFHFKNYSWKHYNIPLIVIVVPLTLASAFLLYLSNDLSHMKRQIMGLALGIVVMAAVSLIDYHILCKFCALYYIGVVILLVLVRFTSLGEDHGTGAYRWLNLRVFDLQVSELAKLALIIVMAVFFSKYKEQINKLPYFIAACVIMVIPTFLVAIQTDLSSSMVMLFIFAVMFFTAGLSYKIIGIILAVGVPGFAVLLWYVQQPWQVILSKKQQERVLGFFNPEKYAASYMYQQNRSVSAISSGGLFGKFLEGNSAPTEMSSKVWVNESDFIFSVAGEVFGFIGCVILVLLLGIVVVRCLITAIKAKDHLGYMLAVGISAMFMFQVFINIGVAISLLPNTGLPLPFLSYGLSSLVCSMIAIGMILNIGLQRKR